MLQKAWSYTGITWELISYAESHAPPKLTEQSKLDIFLEIYFHKVHFKDHLEFHRMTISCSTLLHPSLPLSRGNHLNVIGAASFVLQI